MNNHPKNLTEAEIAEISELKDVREMWGMDTPEEMKQHLRDEIFAVRFDYSPSSPGYIGDLFVLVGDLPEQPVTLCRDQSGNVVVLG